MTTRARQQRRFAILCVTPAVVVFTLWVAWPTARAFSYAMTRWNGFSAPRFVGLQQFRNMVAEPELLLLALRNNLILMTVPTAVALAVSLGLAAAIHRGVRGAGFFQAIFFFPNILSAVAVSVLWLLMYSPTEYGVLNGVRRMLGWAEPYAFTDSSVLIWWLIPMLVWQSVGFFMLLFLASMQNIPESLYEAARLDGASPVDAFLRITLPMLWDTIVVALVFFAIGSLKIFDQIWVFEQQEPHPSSNTIATLLYGKIFEEFRMGEGTAIAIVQFALVLVVTIALLKLWRREALEY